MTSDLAIEEGDDGLKRFGYFLLNLEHDLSRFTIIDIPDAPYPQSYTCCSIEIDETLTDINLKINSNNKQIEFISSRDFFHSLGRNCISLANSNREIHTVVI